MTNRIDFATQLDSDLLAAVRALAQAERQPLEALIEEAMTLLLSTRRPRAHVMAQYEASLLAFDALYQRLAR